MEVRDYNGTGAWTAEAVIQRYHVYCRQHGHPPRVLQPREHVEGDVRWIYPVVDAVIDGIVAADPACVELDVEFVESGHKQPFGRILHAKVARSLRRVALSPDQIQRLRTRILILLIEGQVPHEYRDYARLLRRIGLGPTWPDVRQSIDAGNRYVMRYVTYFDGHANVDGTG